MAVSRRCKSSFRKEGHIHFEEIIICHIEKRVGGAIFNWEQRLVIGFIRDFERIIISDLPSVSPCIQEGRFTVVSRISATLRRVPVIRFRYDRPGQRGFSFCHATIKSRKQFAARNSHKGDGRTSVWAILFNDGTLKRRGHLTHFRHELRQIPLPSVVTLFRQENSPSTNYGFLTVRSPWSVTALSAAHFRSQQPGTLLYIAQSPTFSASCANCVTVTSSFRSHCFAFPISHSSSFEFLLHKYKKYILTPTGRTKTKLADKRKSTHPSSDGC